MISESLQWNYKPPGKISESFQWKVLNCKKAFFQTPPVKMKPSGGLQWNQNLTTNFRDSEWREVEGSEGARIFNEC